MKINDPGANNPLNVQRPVRPPKPGQIPPPNPRGRLAVVRGQDGSRFTDVYHQSLMASWPLFLLGDDPWRLLRFLQQHHSELGGTRAVDALREGRIDQVLAAAENIATGAFA